MPMSIDRITADRRRALWRSRGAYAVAVVMLAGFIVGVLKAALQIQFGYELVNLAEKVPIVPGWLVKAVPPYSHPWGPHDLVIGSIMVVIMLVAAHHSKKAAGQAKDLAGDLEEAKTQERRRGYGLRD